MFIGRHFHSLDGKGRVAIPHKFRAELGGAGGGRVIVTVSPSDRFTYLDVYPAEDGPRSVRSWPLPITGEDAAEIREALLANYIHRPKQTLDTQGGFLVTPDQRQGCPPGKGCRVTGDMQRFRIWSLEEWQALRSERRWATRQRFSASLARL
jgi:MraZ protein